MSGIICLHETKRRKEVGVVLKFDFEKAYDKVNWNLLFACLDKRGFDSKWCMWIRQVIYGGTMSVKVNNKTRSYIKSFKGVRQGDPLSPILLNFVADCLTKMVHKTQENGLVTGLISHTIPNGVAMLEYTDDTIVFLKHDLNGAMHMKLLLYLFEMLAGLKINFNKSQILMVNDDESWGQRYAENFNCQVGLFLIKYLGVPVSPSRLKVIDWLPLVEKGNKRLDVWKGGTLSIAGRSTLISVSLSNSLVITCQFIFSPKLL